MWRLRIVGRAPDAGRSGGLRFGEFLGDFQVHEPVCLHDGADFERHAGLAVGHVLQDVGGARHLTRLVRNLRDHGDLIAHFKSRGAAALDKELGVRADHHAVVLVEEVQERAGLAGTVEGHGQGAGTDAQRFQGAAAQARGRQLGP